LSFILDENKLTYNKSCISKNSCVSKTDDIMNFDGNFLHKKLSNSGYSLGIANKISHPNVNKTWAFLQTTGGKDEPNIQDTKEIISQKP
jgi:hypothetical protein